MELLQLIFKTREERQGVCGTSGEACDDLVVVKAPRLLGIVLDHAFAESHLAVGGEHHFVVFPHAQNRRTVHRFTFSLHRHQVIIPLARRPGQLSAHITGFGQG
jgi:hypothetical protein